ncbi:MAG: glycine cleavage system protein GcvH [Candidatus Dormibacteraceae bacterium]
MSERRYSETHEWVSLDGEVALIGITDFAQAELGDVVYVEMPPVGKHLQSGENFGVIESVKAASDLISPIDGEVIETNPRLADRPELVNQDPQGEGWLIKAKVTAPLGAQLLNATAYQALIENGH